MDSTTTYTYDADGKLISQSIDNNSDGTIDSVINYGYNLTYYSFDGNGDGIADDAENYTYDTKGNKTSFSHSLRSNSKLSIQNSNIFTPCINALS